MSAASSVTRCGLLRETPPDPLHFLRYPPRQPARRFARCRRPDDCEDHAAHWPSTEVVPAPYDAKVSSRGVCEFRSEVVSFKYAGLMVVSQMVSCVSLEST